MIRKRSWTERQCVGNAAGENSTVCGKAGVTIPTVKQGPGTPSVLAIECPLPDLGTFQKDPKPPLSLTLEVTLRDGKAHRSFRLEE